LVPLDFGPELHCGAASYRPGAVGESF